MRRKVKNRKLITKLDIVSQLPEIQCIGTYRGEAFTDRNSRGSHARKQNIVWRFGGVLLGGYEPGVVSAFSRCQARHDLVLPVFSRRIGRQDPIHNCRLVRFQNMCQSADA